MRGIVVFLDGDDWWNKGKLTAVVSAFEGAESVGLVGHGITEMFADGTKHEELLKETERLRLDSAEGARMFRLRKSFLGTSRMAYRRALLKEIGHVPEILRFEVRSILADPRDPEMNAKVNNAVKFREWWRPFAPSMKKESAGEYLESATDSPFMILTAQVRAEKRGVIPSATHVDGSARPQTVEKEVNPPYWKLIDEFGKITGVPVVLNTSLNLRGEAIVHTPTDAIRTFFSSGMDALVVGSYLVEK